MSKWYSIPKSFRMTEREYQANIQGTNIVFGAVIGFVLAASNTLSIADFVLILLYTAAVVVLILYLGSSTYRLFYGTGAVAAIAALPIILEDVPNAVAFGKLQPTLAVWVLMIIMIELIPRTKEAPESIETQTDPTETSQ